MSNLQKYVFGKSQLGRMKRTLECDSTTFDGVVLIPNFKGSQRGAVLKTTNDILLSHGMRKRSQIDSINGEDISTLPYKRIIKTIDEHTSSDDAFSVSFMIPEQTVVTVELYFRGKFGWNYIEFCSDHQNNNLIISSINYKDRNAVILRDKTNIRAGYRVIKVKGIKVVNKKCNDIQKMILTASNDLRVDYAVLFEEGELDWYTLKKIKKTPKSPQKSHNKHAKSMATLNWNAQKHMLPIRRKSGNIPTNAKSTKHTLKPKAKHIKKGKSFDFNDKDDEELLVSPIPLRKNISGGHGNRSKKGTKTPKTPTKTPSTYTKTTKTPKTKRSSKIYNNAFGQIQIGKIVFNTCRLGLTQRQIQCDSDTFIDCDFVPNYKGSQRGAVLKKTNDTLLRHGFTKRTSIQCINGDDVSSASYRDIIHTLNDYISAEEEFHIALQIPEREVKTVEIFFRGNFIEYMEFVSDDKGNNCIIKKIKTNTDIGKILKNKCKLSPGYRITKIKTIKVMNKTFNEIKSFLIESSKDMRIQYLVVFEEGKLGWYGHTETDDLEIIDDKRERPQVPSHPPPVPPQTIHALSSDIVLTKTRNDRKKSPVAKPKPISARSTDGAGIDVKITNQYGITTDTPFDDDDNSGSGYSGFGGSDGDLEASIVVYSSEDDEIKEPEPSSKTPVLKQSVSLDHKAEDSSPSRSSKGSVKINDIAMAVAEEVKEQSRSEENGNDKTEVVIKRKSLPKTSTPDRKKENITMKKMEETKPQRVIKKEKVEVKKKDKKSKKKDRTDNEIWDRDRSIKRQRFIAKIKNVCIAAPFDPNQTLLVFKNKIVMRASGHSKLKGEKNLLKRIKYIKLQTPKLPMLIDCDPRDRLCEIATRKDMIVLHTQSDDELEFEPVYD